MSLAHGEEIGSKKLEAAVGGPAWDADRFARLCNAIIWTEAGQERSSSLSLTERVFVRDNGIDAELEVDVSQSEFDHSRFLVGGWNVLQYKKREGETTEPTPSAGFETQNDSRSIESLKKRAGDPTLMFCW